MAQRLKNKQPYEAELFTKYVAYAIKSLAQGVASEGQQMAAIKWIVDVASRARENPYCPGSDRDTAFAAGRSFVGQQILGIVELDGKRLESLKD